MKKLFQALIVSSFSALAVIGGLVVSSAPAQAAGCSPSPGSSWVQGGRLGAYQYGNVFIGVDGNAGEGMVASWWAVGGYSVVCAEAKVNGATKVWWPPFGSTGILPPGSQIQYVGVEVVSGSVQPTAKPTPPPTTKPTPKPSAKPTARPTPKPTIKPAPSHTVVITPKASVTPAKPVVAPAKTTAPVVTPTPVAVPIVAPTTLSAAASPTLVSPSLPPNLASAVSSDTPPASSSAAVVTASPASLVPRAVSGPSGGSGNHTVRNALLWLLAAIIILTTAWLIWRRRRDAKTPSSA